MRHLTHEGLVFEVCFQNAFDPLSQHEEAIYPGSIFEGSSCLAHCTSYRGLGLHLELNINKTIIRWKSYNTVRLGTLLNAT